MKKNIAVLMFCMLVIGCSLGNEPARSKRVFSIKGKNVSVYTTASNTDLRITLTDKQSFKQTSQPFEPDACVFVNPDKTFQTILGIGGAITDASAEVFDKLPESKQEEFLKAYYSPTEGIGYTLARISIHSCDFSSESFVYVSDEDKELKTFNIDHDRQYRIPLIKKAIKTTGDNLTIFASPWSPPAFMKDSNNMLLGGKLLPEYYQAWALYYTKFIKAYEKDGVPIWGITIQNEPMATQKWESCIYTAEQERDFLKNYLGPTMVREGLEDKKILVWDHNRDLITQRADTILTDPEASKYVWGIAFHWYEGGQSGGLMYENLSRVNESYPDKPLLFTEGCNGDFDAKFQHWPNGERYGEAMISDFNRNTVGWADWNILLDKDGGPNHVDNFNFAPIHGDIEKGELIYTPAYYYIGHFSKFIRPNAKRISTASNRKHLLSTSFINEDGTIATVVMNQGNKEMTYKLFIGQQAVEERILPHSIQTLIY